MKLFLIIYLSLALSAPIYAAEVIDSTEESLPSSSSNSSSKIIKFNKLANSHFEISGSLVNGLGTGATLNWIINPKILVGIQSHRQATTNSQAGGDLDAGQYYSSKWGFSGQTALITVKYFFDNSGIQSRGFFASAQTGRIWRKYEFSQEQFARENGFLGNLFGIDKKLIDSSEAQVHEDGTLTRIGLGYSFPWLARYYLDGLSIQLQMGYEYTTLAASQSISTKFESRKIGSDYKPLTFTELAIAIYF